MAWTERETHGGKGQRWTADREHFGVVVFRVDEPSSTVAPDIDSFFEVSEEVLTERRSHAVVLDLTHAKPDASRRRRVAQWYGRHSDELKRWVAGVAVIAPTAVQRGFITALMWMVRTSIPYRVFASEREAITWAQGTASRAEST